MLKSKRSKIPLVSVTNFFWQKWNESRRPTWQQNHSQQFGIRWSHWLHLTYFLQFNLSIRASWMNTCGRTESGWNCRRTWRVIRDGGAESTRSQDIQVIRIGSMALGQHYPDSDIHVSNYVVTRILEYEILMLLKYLGLLLETLDLWELMNLMT